MCSDMLMSSIEMLNACFRKNAELEQIKETHSNTVLQIQEELNSTLRKLGENVAEFERYFSSIKE